MTNPKLSFERQTLYTDMMVAVLRDDVSTLMDVLLPCMELIDEGAEDRGEPYPESTVAALLHRPHPFPDTIHEADAERSVVINILRALSVLLPHDPHVPLFLDVVHCLYTCNMWFASRLFCPNFKGSPLHVAVVLRHKRCFSALMRKAGRKGLEVREEGQGRNPLSFIQGDGTVEENTAEAEMYLEALDFLESSGSFCCCP